MTQGTLLRKINSSYWLTLFAVFCLLVSLSFIVYRLLTPSDGARLSSTLDNFNSLGANISTYSSAEGVLQEGDVVTAVDGIEMQTWVQSLFSGNIDRPAWMVGQVVEYQILRDGQDLTRHVKLIPFPYSEILKTHWGAILFALISQIVAVFVYLHRREDPAARALFIWALSGSHTYAWSFFLGIGDIVGGFGFWLFRLSTPLLWLIYWPASTHVALVFPRSLPVVLKYRWLIPAIYLASFVIFLGSLAWVWMRSDNILLWLNSWSAVDNFIAALFLGVTMLIIVVQFRRKRRGVEQQQIRWVVFGALVSGFGGLSLWLIYPTLTGGSIIDPNLLGILNLPFPISIALAIWRHHLFDIDVIIRRTLQYSLLTGILASIFFISVVALQAFVTLVSGEQTALITVISTLLIAGLFNPLRHRIQEFIDRRFFRRKYDAEKILSLFAATARDEVDMDRLNSALIGVVQETMQPEKISLWLGEGESQRRKYE